jgi:DNA polymerase-3 subunit beta
MTTQVSINLNALRVAAMFASNDAARYYLQGVHVMPRADGLQISATNGHYLTMLLQPYEDGESAPQWPNEGIILPLTLLANLKSIKRVEIGTLMFENGRAALVCGGISYAENVIDGSFPNVRAVIPREVSGEIAQFNPDYIAQFGKARALLTGKKHANLATISHNGGSPALVDYVPAGAGFEGFGVLMPIRLNSEGRALLTAPPSWALATGEAVAQAA